MKEILLLIGVLVLWFFLNRWLLPRLGVPTWGSGPCAVSPHQTKKPQAPRTIDAPSLKSHDGQDPQLPHLDPGSWR